MKYTSSSGCLFYYDRILYSWRICEPTMLFLLGFEAVTSFDVSQTDNITISKYMFLPEDNELNPLENFEIFDDIYRYLSDISSVEDYETYLKSNCYGLKLLINDLTGTGYDRTVPVIFKNDINNTFLDYTTSYDNALSLYDRQRAKIIDIFEYANYSLSDTEFISSSIGEPPNRPDKQYYIDHQGEYEDWQKAYENDLKVYNSLMILYRVARLSLINSNAMSIHEDRQDVSEIYTRLDYKAMYSYALGVLYGCRCLKYDTNLIWRVNPKFWYTGNYKNLVLTAWYTFRFHYTDRSLLSYRENNSFDEYRGIQINRLWNYSDENTVEQLKQDEILCYSASRNNVEVISYSHSTEPSDTDGEYTYPGSYYFYNADGSYSWHSIDELISDGSNKSGIISLDDDPIIRYISSNEVKIYKAHNIKKSSDEEDSYLSPNTSDIYFIGAGSFGWVNFNETSWLNTSLPYLSPSIIQFEDLQMYGIAEIDGTDVLEQYIGYASNKEDDIIVGYYKCYVRDRGDDDATSNKCFLYGIFDEGLRLKLDTNTGKYIVSEFPNNRTFVRLVCGEDFEREYDLADVEIGDYELNTYYDLSSKISLYTKPSIPESDWWNIEIYTGSSEVVYLGTYGYSLHESQLVSNVFVRDANIGSPVDAELRYEPIAKMYWSKYYTDKTWTSLYNIMILGIMYSQHSTTDLYAGAKRIVKNAVSYKLYRDSSSGEYLFNYNRSSGEYSDNELHISNIESDFKLIHDNNPDHKSLYSLGYTVYACPFVLVDDDGISLTDDNGNPLVWYDPYENKYWNGLYGSNVWQDYKPHATNARMYDAITNTFTPIYDAFNQEHPELSVVSMNNIVMTYSEFYSNLSYGIIRNESDLDSNKVFKPSVSSNILECYHDSYSDKYCIPNYTNQWYTRSELSPGLGWRFVDNYTSLYDGNESITVVYDDDDTD